MSVRPLIHRFDPRLHQKSVAVEVFDDAIKRLAHDMIETMIHENGIGLAAVQVGELRRIAVIGLMELRQSDTPIIMINPIVSSASDEMAERVEGCLSLPGIRLEISRPKSVSVNFQDVNGVKTSIQADGLLAACILHEIDHMDGILIEDKVSRLQRELARKAARKTISRRA